MSVVRTKADIALENIPNEHRETAATQMKQGASLFVHIFSCPN